MRWGEWKGRWRLTGSCGGAGEEIAQFYGIQVPGRVLHQQDEGCGEGEWSKQKKAVCCGVGE